MRALLTYELAGFGAAAEVDCDLLEWNYGNYDGRTSVDIHAERPDWLLFATGILEGKCPPRSRREPIAWSPVSGPYQGRAGVLERHFGSPARHTSDAGRSLHAPGGSDRVS